MYEYVCNALLFWGDEEFLLKTFELLLFLVYSFYKMDVSSVGPKREETRRP